MALTINETTVEAVAKALWEVPTLWHDKPAWEDALDDEMRALYLCRANAALAALPEPAPGITNPTTTKEHNMSKNSEFITKATEAIETLQEKVADLEEFKTKATEAIEALQRKAASTDD